MTAKKIDRKKKQALKNLLEFLEGDGLRVEASDADASGIKAIGDLNFTFKRRKYPVRVSRKETLPTASLEKEMDDSDILMFRKNREDWKVYMDLELLLLLMMNNRS